MHAFEVTWSGLVQNLVWFGTGEAAVTLAEKILRPVAVYLALVYTLRIMGKRVLAQLNPFDLVVLLMLSNTVQNAIIGNDTSLSGGFVGAAALLGVNTILVRYHYRGTAEHGPRDTDEYLIREHKMQEDVLRRYHISVAELTARVHERGFDSLLEVECAVLYPNGTIYIKGESKDSIKIEELLREVKALRRDVAALQA